MYKGRNKPGSHSHSSVNSLTEDFFFPERKVLFGIVERGIKK